MTADSVKQIHICLEQTHEPNKLERVVSHVYLWYCTRPRLKHKSLTQPCYSDKSSWPSVFINTIALQI
jgi:hypothetical protein